MRYMQGPDFPTGGIVTNKDELLSIYETGAGKIKLRGKVEFEPAAKRSERDKLVITTRMRILRSSCAAVI